MKTIVIAPENGTRHLPLLEQLGHLSEFDVRVFPARMLAEVPCGFDLAWARTLNNVDFRPGEIGCAQSHRDVQREIAAGEDEWTVVFEDDARVVDIDGLRTFIEIMKAQDFGPRPVLVSLYTQDAVLVQWPRGPFTRCAIEPSFAVAYCLNRRAAHELARANESLCFTADWPRDSGVDFYVALPLFIAHGDGSTGSFIGVRKRSNVSRAVNKANLSLEVVVNRMALYFVNYFRNRSRFDGYSDYYRKVLRHRVVWHLARLVFRRNRLFARVYVASRARRGETRSPV